jgi:hypothetical protein
MAVEVLPKKETNRRASWSFTGRPVSAFFVVLLRRHAPFFSPKTNADMKQFVIACFLLWPASLLAQLAPLSVEKKWPTQQPVLEPR